LECEVVCSSSGPERLDSSRARNREEPIKSGR
jgi:hypothetical protein